MHAENHKTLQGAQKKFHLPANTQIKWPENTSLKPWKLASVNGDICVPRLYMQKKYDHCDPRSIVHSFDVSSDALPFQSRCVTTSDVFLILFLYL